MFCSSQKVATDVAVSLANAKASIMHLGGARAHSHMPGPTRYPHFTMFALVLATLCLLSSISVIIITPFENTFPRYHVL